MIVMVGVMIAVMEMMINVVPVSIAAGAVSAANYPSIQFLCTLIPRRVTGGLEPPVGGGS